MSQQASLEKIPTLEEVAHLFATWRQANQRPRRIPEDLWEAAVRLCRSHPVSRISRTLGLDYHELKGRVFRLCKALHNRKNWLFNGHPNGAKASASLYSLIETAKACGLEPYQYLRYLFERLPFARSEEDHLALLPQMLTPDQLTHSLL